VVELDADAMRAGFGGDGPMLLAPFDPLALADAIEALLDDPPQRARRVQQGLELAATRTWEAATATVETGLRDALTRAATSPPGSS
jgi:glycosyltransferase involved in cell wall biosynthesis